MDEQEFKNQQRINELENQINFLLVEKERLSGQLEVAGMLEEIREKWTPPGMNDNGETIEDLEKTINFLDKELARVKSGNLSKEEINDMCHQVQETLSVTEFCEGCKNYQKELFGVSPIELLEEKTEGQKLIIEDLRNELLAARKEIGALNDENSSLAQDSVELRKLKERNRLLEDVVACAREMYTASEIVRSSDPSEDDYYRLTEATDELYDSLKKLDETYV